MPNYPKNYGSILSSILIITTVISLLTLSMVYVINEHFNGLNTLNHSVDIRHNAYRYVNLAEKKIEKDLFNTNSNGNVALSSKYIPGSYRITLNQLLNDNLASFNGSIYFPYHIDAKGIVARGVHGSINYRSMYWQILSFYQFDQMKRNHLKRKIFLPVVNLDNIDKQQKGSYIDLLKRFQNISFYILMNDTYLTLSNNQNKSDTYIDIGFNCQMANHCQLSDGWFYKEGSYYYVLMIRNNESLSVWVVEADQISHLNDRRILKVNLKAHKLLKSGVFKNVLELFNHHNKNEIITEVTSNKKPYWVIWPLDKGEKIKIETIDTLTDIIRVFPISKLLNLDTTGFFAIDQKNTLWYLDQLLNTKKIKKMSYNAHLVDLSLNALENNQYQLTLFFETNIEAYELNSNFKIIKKLWRKESDFKISKGSTRFGLIWLRGESNQIKAFNQNDRKVVFNRRILNSQLCYFASYFSMKFSCGNTDFKISDILRPYQREAFRQIEAY